MDTQVWMKLAQQFKKALSVYNSSSGTSDSAVLRPYLKKAGKSFFEVLENEAIEISTPPEFLTKPVLENVMDSSGRIHRCLESYDRYWICVLGLLGRTGYIIVKNKKLREMQIPSSHIDGEIKVDWELFYMARTEPFLLNEKDYLTDVCEASIQACRFLISEYGDVAKKPAEAEHDIGSLAQLVTNIADPQVKGYVEEAIKCLQVDALRACIVFLWAGAIRTVQGRLLAHGKSQLNAAVQKHDPKARTISTIDHFAYIKDKTTLLAAQKLGEFDKNEKDTLEEALNLRNRCGHPGKYRPGVKKTSSFIEDIISVVFK